MATDNRGALESRRGGAASLVWTGAHFQLRANPGACAAPLGRRRVHAGVRREGIFHRLFGGEIPRPHVDEVGQDVAAEARFDDDADGEELASGPRLLEALGGSAEPVDVGQRRGGCKLLGGAGIPSRLALALELGLLELSLVRADEGKAGAMRVGDEGEASLGGRHAGRLPPVDHLLEAAHVAFNVLDGGFVAPMVFVQLQQTAARLCLKVAVLAREGNEAGAEASALRRAAGVAEEGDEGLDRVHGVARGRVGWRRTAGLRGSTAGL
mmetsp:Transcript_6906/g.21048  ORF Transcript_6906/g.21048 Transcript_6906/m.21048 type:complete len:268 (-) Transcript_6906:117-920(-)|eukprot:CAMPEP_0197388724 /NCGR_PEP_ID=MMETSP1165-20131217/1226_1 /TAXON_ID=284809 /ORGANISM="Chrysocystis fragilis, Strain CCMP3189" /LENGTH=267 /DNA_ID=CAMNT_0042914075 /DNA_START=67 /DNA_END=870 /DNA_ORIENTATION=-